MVGHTTFVHNLLDVGTDAHRLFWHIYKLICVGHIIDTLSGPHLVPFGTKNLSELNPSSIVLYIYILKFLNEIHLFVSKYINTYFILVNLNNNARK